jgi:hypothetical protein
LAGSYQPILGDWAFAEKMAQPSQSKYIIKNNEYFKKIAFFMGCSNYREGRSALLSTLFGNNSCHSYIALLVNRLTSALTTARK